MYLGITLLAFVPLIIVLLLVEIPARNWLMVKEIVIA